MQWYIFNTNHIKQCKKEYNIFMKVQKAMSSVDNE